MLDATDKRVQPLSIQKNMIWNSAGSFVNLVCAWCITVLVLRLSTGYDEAGVYSYVMSIYAIFSSVADFRIYLYQISDVHGENTMGEYFALRLITGGMALVLTMVYGMLSSAPGLWLPILFYSLYKIAGTLLDTFHAVQQAKHRMDYMGMSYAIQGIASLAVFAAVFGPTQNLTLTLAAMFGVTVLIGIVYDLPRGIYFEDLKVRISWGKAWHLLVTCVPAVVAFIAISSATSVPRQYLMNSMGEAALGAYGTMAAPIAIIQTGASYIYNPLCSYFVDAFEARNRKRFNKLMLVTILAIALLGVVCLLGVEWFAAPLYALIYGEQVLEYTYLLPPLVIGCLAIAFSSFMNSLATVLRNFKATFVGGLVAFGVSLALMVPLINALGLNGVTYTTMVSALVASLVMYVLIHRQMNENFNSAPKE